MDPLLKAILEDDRLLVKNLLAEERTLSIRQIDTAKLYETSICHWTYVGDTALHLAAAGYRVEIVKALIAAGADPNAAFNHRRSGPLHYAADGQINSIDWNAKRQVKTIDCLLTAGADIDSQDKNGATPLHRAVRTRCVEAARCLMKSGCDVNRTNKSGSTAFHLAVQNTGRGGSGTADAKIAQRQLVELFLSNGVSTALKDGHGKSIIDCASSSDVRALFK